MGYINFLTTEKSLFSLLGIFSGIAIHHGLFIYGEWHNQAPKIFSCYAIIFGCITTSELFVYKSHIISRLVSGLFATSFCHVFSLITSILLYRGFFHRLNKAKFPGPWWARYTKIGQIWENRHSKNYLYLHGLNQTYGDVVRTGKVLPQTSSYFGPRIFR